MSTTQVTTPFNLEAAKAGKPVCTKWGLPVRIVDWEFKAIINYPLIAVVGTGPSEFTGVYNLNGRHVNNDGEYDLRMSPEIFTKWVNVVEINYDTKFHKKGYKFFYTYDSEEQAKTAASSYSDSICKVVAVAKRVDIEL